MITVPRFGFRAGWRRNFASRAMLALWVSAFLLLPAPLLYADPPTNIPVPGGTWTLMDASELNDCDSTDCGHMLCYCDNSGNFLLGQDYSEGSDGVECPSDFLSWYHRDANGNIDSVVRQTSSSCPAHDSLSVLWYSTPWALGTSWENRGSGTSYTWTGADQNGCFCAEDNSCVGNCGGSAGTGGGQGSTASGSATPAAQPAVLEVLNPSLASAELWLDDQLLGIGHGQYATTEGTHTLVVRVDGFVPATVELELRAGEIHSLEEVRLSPERAALLVESSVAGASVSLAGAAMGTTPFGAPLRMEAAGGTHRLEVTRDGYDPLVALVSLDVNAETSVQITLQTVSAGAPSTCEGPCTSLVSDRYLVQRDGTVVDFDANLVWQNLWPGQQVSSADRHFRENSRGERELYDGDADEYCSELTYAGYSNWRVPTRSELRSIATTRIYSGCYFNDQVFEGACDSYHTSERGMNGQYYVDFTDLDENYWTGGGWGWVRCVHSRDDRALTSTAALPATGTASSVATPPVVQAPPPLIGLNSEWVGTYRCAQGLTNATLSVRNVTNNSVTAVFAFAHGRISGSYWLHGTVDPATRDVLWRTGDWIQQPSGYMTVGLAGTISQDGQRMSGTVSHSSCSDFDLSRVP